MSISPELGPVPLSFDGTNTPIGTFLNVDDRCCQLFWSQWKNLPKLTKHQKKKKTTFSFFMGVIYSK